MRTTREIDDETFRRAKMRAAATGQTMGELVAAALGDALEGQEKAAAEPFQMPVFGGASRRVQRSPAALARLRDEGR